MSWEGTAVIRVVVLQKSMDLLQFEPGSMYAWSWKGIRYVRSDRSRDNNNFSNKDGTQCKLCACGECYTHFLQAVARIACPYISVSLWNKKVDSGKCILSSF